MMGPLYAWIKNQTVNQLNLENPFVDVYTVVPEYTDLDLLLPAGSNYTYDPGLCGSSQNKSSFYCLNYSVITPRKDFLVQGWQSMTQPKPVFYVDIVSNIKTQWSLLGFII